MFKNKNIFIILFLFLFFNQLIKVQSQETINYDSDAGFVEKNLTNSEITSNYKLYFQQKGDIPLYLKVILTPNLGEDTPRLCYSPTSSTCDTDRRILSQRNDKKPVIAFVKADEVNQNSREIYFSITCKQRGCNYLLRFEGDTTCKISTETVYSYIVTTSTILGMDFEVIGKANENTDINIAIEGSNTAIISLKDESIRVQPLFFEGGKLYTYILNKTCNESCSLSIFTLSNAKPGEYIRLNVHTVHNQKAPDNLLYPGGPTVVGIVHNEGANGPEECFPVSAFANEEFSLINQFYLTGKIYSKYGLFWLADENDKYIEETEIEISDGYLAFLVKTGGKKRSICFKYSYDETIKQRNVIFSISIIPIAQKTTPDFYYLPPPQMVGQTLRRMLQKQKSVIYHSSLLDSSYERFNFHIFNIKGVVRLYISKCTNFPDCTYDMSEGSKDLDKMELVENTGKILLYDRPIEKTVGALDKEKTVMVVTCLDDGNDQEGYCEFDTSIYALKQTITLVENQNFAKYALKDEKGTFKIDFKGAVKLMSVSVEIMIHSGEVLFSENNFENGDLGQSKLTGFGDGPQIKKYILPNKVLIIFDLHNSIYENLLVFYLAIKNSFFTIKYIYYKSEDINQFKHDFIFPGESYLVQIDPSVQNNYKNVQFYNDRYKYNQIYMTNFFALNCEFKVITNKTKTGETEIEFADGYAQDTIDYNEGDIYKSEYYNYRISIEKVDYSNYENKMCMLYVAGYQNVDLYFTTRILTSNNVNQQIIFNDNFNNIRFLYPLADINNDLIIYANIIDKAKYYIEIYVDKKNNVIAKNIITSSIPFYIKREQFDNFCSNFTFCNIIISMELVNTFPDLPETDPMVEITVREATKINDTLRVPTYLQKGIAKKDFTTGDGYYYLYTMLGKNDQGDITVNFFRDFGEVYGHIVPMNTIKREPNYEWMNLYRLPSNEYKEDSLNYNPYLKKYEIKLEDTLNCDEGCYLILGIIISQIGEWAEDWKFYPFSIITRITPNNLDEVQKVVIQVDEFIIGNVEVSKFNNKKISQVYEVWLPHDTSDIYFDFQSELAGLYINIDSTIPNAENADFKFISKGIESIFVLEKSQIFDKAKEKKMKIPEDSSLEDWNFVIGIWTDKTDSADSELYSLRVHEPNLDTINLDIIEVNTDQKILCKPTYIGDKKYRCLFMVIFDDQDILQKMDLLVFSRSMNKSDTTEISASFIEQHIYNEFTINELRANIPTYENAQYDSIRDDFNYLCFKLDESQKGKYLYVNVISLFPDDIMMVSSINSYENIKPGWQLFYPSARTEQLIQIKEENLLLEFFSNTSLVVNIEDLGGEADLSWEEDYSIVYNLRNKNDRLILTTKSNFRKLNLKKISSDSKTKDDLDPGFVFMLSYHTRDVSINFDQVPYGNNVEIGYLDSDLPVFLISKSIDYSNDINLAITFLNSFKDNNEDKEGSFSSSPLFIKAALDKRDAIYAAKLTPGFEPSPEHTVNGIYDPVINTGQVFMSNTILNKYNISEKDFPTLYLYIGKTNEYKNMTYNYFNIEAQITRKNSLVIPTENVYYYGKFFGLNTQYYKLKNDKKKDIMKIILAFNSNYLNWTIGDLSSHTNASDLNMEIEEGRGKIIITIKPGDKDFIYINIFKNNNGEEQVEELQNYVFKYLNLENDSQFSDYKIINNNASLNCNQGENRLYCVFNRINIASDKANITYFLKIIDSKDYIKNEKIETISLTQSPYYVTFIRNPIDSNNKITINAFGDFPQWTYLQVIAQIQQNNILEYVAYKPVYKERKIDPSDSEENNEEKDNTSLFIGVSISLVVIIIGLVILVIYFKKRNKSLMNQVKHVSFQQSESSEPDLLLGNQ